MTVPTPEEFMTPDTLADNKNRGGWSRGARTGEGPNPTRVTIGTAEDERGDT